MSVSALKGDQNVQEVNRMFGDRLPEQLLRFRWIGLLLLLPLEAPLLELPPHGFLQG
jgi:hypothetical protein